MSGLIGTRDGRLFSVGITYDFDASGSPLEKGHGWIHRWKEIPQDDIREIGPGLPNSWAQAVHIARMIFDSETGAGPTGRGG